MLCGNCAKLLFNKAHVPSMFRTLVIQSKSRHQCVQLLNQPQKPAHSRSHSSVAEADKWTKPDGYDSGVMIYHPLVKQKVPLILRQEKMVQWYACGPTVYDSSHLGHASSYVRLDIIRRILANVFGVDTTLVMGITDVDDKIIIKSKESGQAIDDLTKFYEEEFFADMAKLNVSPPTIITRVREHIPQIISFVQAIESKALAYATQDGSVYFDVKKYGKYGQFAVQRDNTEEGGAAGKRNSQDFALWKAAKKGEPSWVSPWGHGRPGWHVECSVMASEIFGANFDVHSGGEDLIFPHHENELAQSCAFHGNQQWANYWLHTGHLFITGQTDKMSKSLKNVVSVFDFLAGYSPNHFRMLCLLNNYKKRIEYSEERLQKAVSVVSAINSIVRRCDLYSQGQMDCATIPEAELYQRLHSTRQVVERAFADDFNTPQALANVMRLIKFTNQVLETKEPQPGVRSCAPVAAVGVYLQRLMNQLGMDVAGTKAENNAGTSKQFHTAVESVVKARARIRDFAKDKRHIVNCADQVGIPEEKARKLMKSLYKPLWETSDSIRDDMLTSSNIQINDGADGSTWFVVDPTSSSTEEKSEKFKKPS